MMLKYIHHEYDGIDPKHSSKSIISMTNNVGSRCSYHYANAAWLAWSSSTCLPLCRTKQLANMYCVELTLLTVLLRLRLALLC